MTERLYYLDSSIASFDATVTGCSRTDSGVHANEYCVLIEAANSTVPKEKLPVALKSFLPADISLFYAELCNNNFHVRYDAKFKEYLYIIRNAKVANPFLHDRCWLLPRIISDVGLEKMRLASKSFLGEHDFSSFMAEGSSVTDTKRCVYSLDIEREDDLIKIRIRANGFLYNMVRIIVGTLTEVAFGRIEPGDIMGIIDSKNRSLAGPTAPASGLYLNKVEY
jgi:tRNA pseudouridine38-40 synthase